MKLQTIWGGGGKTILGVVVEQMFWSGIEKRFRMGGKFFWGDGVAKKNCGVWWQKSCSGVAKLFWRGVAKTFGEQCAKNFGA